MNVYEYSFHVKKDGKMCPTTGQDTVLYYDHWGALEMHFFLVIGLCLLQYVYFLHSKMMVPSELTYRGKLVQKHVLHALSIFTTAKTLCPKSRTSVKHLIFVLDIIPETLKFRGSRFLFCHLCINHQSRHIGILVLGSLGVNSLKSFKQAV